MRACGTRACPSRSCPLAPSWISHSSATPSIGRRLSPRPCACLGSRAQGLSACPSRWPPRPCRSRPGRLAGEGAVCSQETQLLGCAHGRAHSLCANLAQSACATWRRTVLLCSGRNVDRAIATATGLEGLEAIQEAMEEDADDSWKRFKNLLRDTARGVIRDVMKKHVRGEEKLVLCKSTLCLRSMQCTCRPVRQKLRVPDGVPGSRAIGTLALPKARASQQQGVVRSAQCGRDAARDPSIVMPSLHLPCRGCVTFRIIGHRRRRTSASCCGPASCSLTRTSAACRAAWRYGLTRR